MSGNIWTPKDSERYEQIALEAIEKVVCYEKNGKIFLLLIFKDEKCIEYVRDEMAFVLDDNLESLNDFAGLPNLVRKNSLLVQIPERLKPHGIAIIPIPVKGVLTNKEKKLPVIGYDIEQSVPSNAQPEAQQAEIPKI